MEDNAIDGIFGRAPGEFELKIMICGGGTAGHVYPGLALAESLRSLNDQVEVVWVGTPGGLEAGLAPAAGYKFIPIKVSGLRRRLSWRALKAVYQLIIGLVIGRKLLKKQHPAAVVGMGGYVSLPVILAAGDSYPSIIFEQNSIPGLANRILAPRVSAAVLTYEESRSYFERTKQVIVTGNPVRTDGESISRSEAALRLGVESNRLTVLIFGGSRGARRINMVATELYPHCRGSNGLQIIHITGNMEFEATAKLLSKHESGSDKAGYHLYSYLEEIWLAYAASDLVVCRAGATTLAEITARGLPAILIPYPHATDNHQFKNARILESAGAAKLIADEDLDGRLLWRTVSDLIGNPAALKDMADRSREAGRPHAAESAAKLVLSLAEKK